MSDARLDWTDKEQATAVAVFAYVVAGQGERAAMRVAFEPKTVRDRISEACKRLWLALDEMQNLP